MEGCVLAAALDCIHSRMPCIYILVSRTHKIILLTVVVVQGSGGGT